MTLNRKERHSVNKARTAIGSIAMASLLTLTGCGGDDSGGSTNSPSESTSAPTGRSGGFDSGQIEKIQACLKAAGLEDKLPSERPSGLPTDLPTDLPSDLPTDLPSGLPSDLPSGLPSGAAGGDLGALQDPEVQQALKACGIDLPEGPGQN